MCWQALYHKVFCYYKNYGRKFYFLTPENVTRTSFLLLFVQLLKPKVIKEIANHDYYLFFFLTFLYCCTKVKFSNIVVRYFVSFYT